MQRIQSGEEPGVSGTQSCAWCGCSAGNCFGRRETQGTRSERWAGASKLSGFNGLVPSKGTGEPQEGFSTGPTSSGLYFFKGLSGCRVENGMRGDRRSRSVKGVGKRRWGLGSWWGSKPGRNAWVWEVVWVGSS